MAEEDNDALEAAALQAILQAVRKTFRRLANELQENIRSVASNPIGSTAFNMERAISITFRPDEFVSKFRADVEDAFISTHVASAESMLRTLGIDVDAEGIIFSPRVLADINAQITRTGQLVFDTTRTQVRDLIAKMLREGIDDIETMSQRIAALINDPHRATLIARTERTGAISGGQYAAADQAWRSGIVVGKKWSTRLDGRERDSHLAQHGQVIPFDGRFDNGARFPGDPLLPASEACNCFLPDTLISGEISAAIRADYDGEIVVVRTESSTLKLTPNHPVLTDVGWVPAKDLHSGSKLVSWEDEVASGSGPDVDNVKPTVQQLFDAMTETGQSRRVIGVAVDLYGDVVGEDVDVVPADGSLLIHVSSHGAQEISDFLFSNPHTSISPCCPDSEFGLTSSGTPHGGVGLSDPIHPVLCRAARSANDVSFTYTSDGNSNFDQPAPRNLSAHPEADGDLLLRLAAHVSADKVVNVNIDPSTLRARISQALTDPALADAEAFSESKAAFPGVVKLVDVIDVDVESWSGHVYTFESPNGWFTVNENLITQNCRCTLSFVRRGSTEGDSLRASLIEGGERWAGLLCEVDSSTSDGRVLTGDITWRMLPLPLFLQPEQAGAHDGAVQVGVIDSMERINNSVFGYGYLFPNHPLHDRALEIIESLSGQLSVDPAEAKVYEDEATGLTVYVDPVLSGVTITAGPSAFDTTRIWLQQGDPIDEGDDYDPSVEEEDVDMPPTKGVFCDMAEAVVLQACPEDSDEYVDLTALEISGWPAHFAAVGLNDRRRDQMPVIEPEQVPGFLQALEGAGIPYVPVSLDPRSLSAGQNELNGAKVASMIRSKRRGQFDDNGLEPLVSRDGRLIDGHHRWAADVIIRHADGDHGDDSTYVVIDMVWPDLIAFADEYAASLGNEGKDVTASSDLSDALAEWSPGNESRPTPDDGEDEQMTASAAPLNLFEQAVMQLVRKALDESNQDPSDVVAAAPLTFDAAAFKDRKFTKGTPITIDADGNVYGHAALWSQCHRGIAGRCQLAPRDPDGGAYKHFNLRRIETTEGPMMVGQLTAGIGHAAHGMSANDTMAHYDNTNAIWAFVRAYEDRFGIVVVGKVLPDVTPEQLTRAGHTLSGDWRKIDGKLRMMALLSVPVPGFSVTASMSPEDEGNDIESVQATFGLEEDEVEEFADEPCVECDELRASAMSALRALQRKDLMRRLNR